MSSAPWACGTKGRARLPPRPRLQLQVPSAFSLSPVLCPRRVWGPLVPADSSALTSSRRPPPAPRCSHRAHSHPPSHTAPPSYAIDLLFMMKKYSNNISQGLNIPQASRPQPLPAACSRREPTRFPCSGSGAEPGRGRRTSKVGLRRRQDGPGAGGCRLEGRGSSPRRGLDPPQEPRAWLRVWWPRRGGEAQGARPPGRERSVSQGKSVRQNPPAFRGSAPHPLSCGGARTSCPWERWGREVTLQPRGGRALGGGPRGA